MAGFLERLAARALAAMPVAHPVIPPSFAASGRVETIEEQAWGSAAREPGTQTNSRQDPPHVLPSMDRAQAAGQPPPRLFATQAEETLPPLIVQAPPRSETPAILPVAQGPAATLPHQAPRPRTPSPARAALAFPAAASRREAAVPSEPAAAPPPIRISIGRIDVRAEFAPAPGRPAAAKPAPAMSLEEYRRKRDGGRR